MSFVIDSTSATASFSSREEKKKRARRWAVVHIPPARSLARGPMPAERRNTNFDALPHGRVLSLRLVSSAREPGRPHRSIFLFLSVFGRATMRESRAKIMRAVDEDDEDDERREAASVRDSYTPSSVPPIHQSLRR